MNQDDMDALRDEYFMTLSPGWGVFKATLLEKFQEDSAMLCFGTYKDDRERMQAEGRCQLYKYIADHESAVGRSYTELQEELQKAQHPEQEEGGDLGVSYEAAQ